MPLTLENAAALVPGGPSPRAIQEERKDMQQTQPRAQQPQTLKVKVLRAFYYQGKAVDVNSTVALPRVFALEMAAANKAALVTEAEKPAAPASTSAKSAEEKKGDRNAR